WLYIVLSLAWPAGAWLAWYAVRLARRGAFADEGLSFAPLREREAATPLVALSSPMQAQLWLEWRGQGRLFLVMVGICLALSMPVVHLAATFLPEPAFLEGLPHLRGPVERFGSAWVSVAYLPLILLFSSGMFGAEMGRLARFHDGPDAAGYFLSLPFPSVNLLPAHLLVAAARPGGCWGRIVGLVP